VNAIGLWTIAKDSPDALAVVNPDGTEIGYGQFVANADRYARGLQALGLRTGSCVGMMLPNSADALALFFAAFEAGLYIVPVNWHLAAAEVGYILDNSGAEAFVAHERFAATAAGAADIAGIPANARFGVGDVPGFAPLAELGAAEPDGPVASPTQGAPMVYTSGTSGRPKGVRRALTGADPYEVPMASTGFFSVFGIKPLDGHVHICCSPLYHTAVLNFSTISLQLGHPVVLMDKFDAEEMLRLIAAYRVTHSHMVPTQFKRLLALPEDVRAKYDVTSLRAMIHGAAPCPNEVKRQMLDWWGPVVIEYYAASEGGGTVLPGEEWERKPGSVGRPWPYSEIKILDDDKKELPVGEPGLVYMRMGNAQFSYFNDDEKTREARADGNLFTVGDIGYLDEDGYLFLHDRKSDMIISGGVNIYPAEVESELTIHPKVTDVAVFGIPHDEWGEEVKAVVQPAPGVAPGPDLTAELLEHLSSRVAKFKLPKSIDYVDELPRQDNGKLYKRKLRDPYWQGRERAI
jgi:long-chain acyl-CoA synthetase